MVTTTLPISISKQYNIIEERIATRTGCIYVAEDRDNESNRVLIQVIDKEKSGLDALLTITAECRAMSRLHHPNLARIFEIEQDCGTGSIAVIMEYFEGFPIIGADGAIGKQENTLDETIALLVSLCRVLSFLHTKNIIHRNINPENIIRTSDAKIKLLNGCIGELENSKRKHHGIIAYLAPESIRGTVDIRTDIFPLGVTLYELITGSRFYGELKEEAILELLVDAGRFQDHASIAIQQCQNDALHSILKRMLSYYPVGRFGNCIEIIDAVNQSLKTQYEYETSETARTYLFGTNIIGRSDELKKMIHFTQEPQSNVVWVQAEHGMGKTRLFQEFKLWCIQNDIPFLQGSCAERFNTQFNPILEIVQELLPFVQPEIAERFGPELKKLFPDLPCFSAFPVGFCHEPKTEHALLSKNLIDFIIDGISSNDKIFVIYIDDIQLADESTLEVIDALINLIMKKNISRKIHLYMSLQMEGIEAFGVISKTRGISVLKLNAFNEQNVQQYLQAVFGKNLIGSRIQELVPLIHYQVKGNPLLLQELLRFMVETGIVSRTQSCWDLSSAFDPENLQEDLCHTSLERANRLGISSEERQVIYIVALLGRPVDLEELKQFVPVSDGFLDLLESAEIIRSYKKRGKRVYEISHCLIRNCIEDKMIDKKQIHGTIARTLERISVIGMNVNPEELAYHFQNAGENDQAISYLKQVMFGAIKLCQYEKALSCCDTILALLPAKDDLNRIDVLNDKTDILHIYGKKRESLELINFIKSQVSSMEPNPVKGRAYYNAALELGASSGQQAIDLLIEAAAIFESFQDYNNVADIYSTVGSFYFESRNYQTATEYLQKSSEILKNNGDLRGLACNLETMCKIQEAIGAFKEAMDCCDRSLEIFKNLDCQEQSYFTKHHIALSIGFQGFIHASNNNHLAALRSYDVEIAMADVFIIPNLSLTGRIRRAESLYYLKQFDDAKSCCETFPNFINKTTNQNLKIMATIIASKIAFVTGNAEKGIGDLSNLISQCNDPFDIARINYELWSLTGKPKNRENALAIYKEKAASIPNWRFKKRIAELEANALPDASINKSGAYAIDTNRIMNQQSNDATNQESSLEERMKEELTTTISGSLDRLLSERFACLNTEIAQKYFDMPDNNTLLAEIHRNAYFQELLTIIHDLNSILDLEILLEKILDVCIHLLEAERGAILLTDKNDKLVLRKARTAKQEKIDNSDFSVPRTVISKLRDEQRSTLFIPDLLENSTIATSKSVLDMKLRSIMATSLFEKSSKQESEANPRLIGIIYLDSQQATCKSGFVESNAMLLQILADQASVALQNSMLKQQLEESIDEKSNVTFALGKELMERKAAEEMITVLNANLEIRIKEKTEELHQTQKSLLEHSYKAGMADIATAVLHSTGNTLNSAVISCQTLETTLSNSKIPLLLKANDILREHKGNFEEFLTKNPKGRTLLEYYLALGDSLKQEYELLHQQTQRIHEMHDLIRHSIQSQEAYIVPNQPEWLSIPDILEETLLFLKNTIQDQHITVQTKYETIPTIKGQKFKIKHLFTNIITNSLEAMETLPSDNRILKIVACLEGSLVKILVTDSGVGINPENITRIFAPSYTTKADHFGFGLHTCANYVSEMNGTIEATSDGDGKGTTICVAFRTK